MLEVKYSAELRVPQASEEPLLPPKGGHVFLSWGVFIFSFVSDSPQTPSLNICRARKDSGGAG